MTITTYGRGSPYSATPQSSWALDNLKIRQLLPDASDTFYVIPTRYNQRPYNLSYDLYGTKDYWWIFMQMNLDLIRDPIYDFKAGITIRVPSKERLMTGMEAEK